MFHRHPEWPTARIGAKSHVVRVETETVIPASDMPERRLWEMIHPASRTVDVRHEPIRPTHDGQHATPIGRQALQPVYAVARPPRITPPKSV